MFTWVQSKGRTFPSQESCFLLLGLLRCMSESWDRCVLHVTLNKFKKYIFAFCSTFLGEFLGLAPKKLFYISAISILLFGPLLRFYISNIWYFLNIWLIFLVCYYITVATSPLKLLKSLAHELHFTSSVSSYICSLQLFSCGWFSCLITADGPKQPSAAFLHARVKRQCVRGTGGAHLQLQGMRPVQPRRLCPTHCTAQQPGEPGLLDLHKPRMHDTGKACFPRKAVWA